MLHSLKKSYGEKLVALDGQIGQVKDFYFDDRTWTIRYVVAETGTWLTSRQVLLSPRVVGSLFQNGRDLSVNLTCKCSVEIIHDCIGSANAGGCKPAL